MLNADLTFCPVVDLARHKRPDASSRFRLGKVGSRFCGPLHLSGKSPGVVCLAENLRCLQLDVFLKEPKVALKGTTEKRPGGFFTLAEASDPSAWTSQENLWQLKRHALLGVAGFVCLSDWAPLRWASPLFVFREGVHESTGIRMFVFFDRTKIPLTWFGSGSDQGMRPGTCVTGDL